MQAVVFFNRRDQLLNRVKRIASRRNNTLNSLEKGLLALALIIMVGLSSAFSGHSVLRPVKNSKLSPADSSAIVHEKTLMRSIIADLQKDKVVKSADDLLWFGLNDEKMMVNGKLLPDNLYREFKQKYLLQPGIGFYYGHVQMTGTGYFYSKEELER